MRLPPVRFPARRLLDSMVQCTILWHGLVILGVFDKVSIMLNFEVSCVLFTLAFEKTVARVGTSGH